MQGVQKHDGTSRDWKILAELVHNMTKIRIVCWSSKGDDQLICDRTWEGGGLG